MVKRARTTFHKKRIRSVSPMRSELSAQGRASGSRDVPMEPSPPQETQAEPPAESPPMETQAEPPADAPMDPPPRKTRRKCYDGYYRMMTIREWTDHLIEYEDEYEESRLAIAERGYSIFPDLTEEEDRARFTEAELLMEEEARFAAHAERTFEDRVKAQADLTRREQEEKEAREAAEDQAAKAAFAAEMVRVMRPSR